MADPLSFHDPVPATDWRPSQRPAGFGEVFGASFDLAQDDTLNADERRTEQGYGAIVDAVNDARAREGKPRLNNPGMWAREADARFSSEDYGFRFWSAPMRGVSQAEQKAILFGEIARLRASDPGFLKGMPDTADAYDRHLIEEQKKRRASDKATVANGEGLGATVAGLGGSISGSMTDPLNILTLPLGGGGKTVMQVAAREALTNGLIEAVEQPFVAENRETLGEELTPGEAVTNVLTAAAGGAVIGGSLKGVELHGGTAIRAAGNAYDSAIEKVFNALPEKYQGRWASAMEIPDDVLPGLAREVIGADRMTPDELAAIHVIERQIEVDALNPFHGSGTSADYHNQQMAAAMRAIMDEAPAPDYAARARSAIGDTALSTRTVGAPIETPDLPANTQAIKAAIGRVENASGGLTVTNPNSSATGPYQFTRGTWIATYKQRFGAGGLSDDQIWGLRTRGRDLHEQLMDTLISANARALRRAGFAETKGNLYLAHFAGDRGAIRILSAAPDTPIERVLSAEAIAANRSVLDGKTAGDVVVWAHRKMGAAPSGGRAASGGTVEAGEVGTLQAEATVLQAEADRLGEVLAARGEQEGVGRAGAAAEPGAASADGGARVASSADAATSMEDLAPPIDVREVVAPDAPRAIDPEEAAPIDRAVQHIVELAPDRSQSLDPARLSQVLAISEDQARRALALAAGRAEAKLTITQSGHVRRMPRARGPEDAITFLARRGGLRNDEGHDLAGALSLDRFVPGAGKLLRKQGGRRIDEAGELLHEAGYFGPPSTTSRPTEAEVLDFLDRANREKAFAVQDIDAAASRARSAAEADAASEIEGAIDSVLSLRGVEFDAAEMADAVALVHVGGRDIDDAILEVINGQIEDIRLAAAIEADELAYDDWDALWKRDDDRSPSQHAGSDSERPEGTPGDARAGGEGNAEYPGLAEDLDWASGRYELDAEAYRGFDTPDSPGAKVQAESLEHDARMELPLATDPAIADRQRQEARLRADAPLQGGAKTGQAQDGEMGLGLFDAADQSTFRLDIEGDERALPDLLNDIAQDEDAIAKARACLAPPKGGGA